ncbi:transposase family protein [Microcoleus sp. N3A4]
MRDLSIFGRLVYLKVPRRQFYCGECKKFPTESLTKAKSSPKANK